MNKQILDKDFHAGWGNFVFDEKEIIWSGTPNIEYTFRFLENKTYHDVMTGLSSIVAIYSMGLISICYNLYTLGFEMSSIIFAIFGTITPFAFEILRSKNQKKTQYAITEKYVLFKFYNFTGYKIEFISMDSIVRTHVQRMLDGKATIYLIPNKKANFSTYNGENGKRQDHPTLELIDNYEEANEIIYQIAKANNLSAPNYEVPTISEKFLKISKYVYLLLLSLASIYLVDFSVFITKPKTDTIISVSLGIPNENTKNGRYLTEKDYSFSMREYSPRLLNKEIIISATFIFCTIKEVTELETNIKRTISSSLNRPIILVSYILVLLALLIGYGLIYNKQQITQELYGKIIVSFTFYACLMYYIWTLHN